MKHPIHIGRIEILAAGLGILAALASTPPLAAADPPGEPLSWIDQLMGGLGIPAATAPLDMQISISGIDLFPTLDNTAIASSGFGSLAVAVGDGANADASGGFFDFAYANGVDSTAGAGLAGNLDAAIANGDHSNAGAGIGGSLVLAVADGNSSTAGAGIGSNLDIAAAIGDGSKANVGVGGGADIAIADGTGGTANAGLGQLDIASAMGSGSDASAIGNLDAALVVGDGSGALAGSGATAPGGFDLAAAFGDMLHASATGGDFLINVLPSP